MLESSKVPALTRAIDILNLIARIGPCSAATIIDTLGIPKSTACCLMNSGVSVFLALITRKIFVCGPGWWSFPVMR